MAGKPKPLPKPAPPPVHAPAPAPKPTPPPTWGAGQQSVYTLMMDLLQQWGIPELAGDLKKLIISGDTAPNTLSLALSQTQAYKDRFAGNAIRVKNGLPELLPSQYIALEEGYHNVLAAYGFPKGFYDSRSDFTDLIGKDVSTEELKTRAQVAHDQYMAAPEYVRNLWTQYYGTKGDMLAAILDPNTATQLIADRGQQVAIGGAAKQFGFDVNQQRAQQFQQAGVTLAGAQRAYQQISQIFGTDQSIAKRFGTTFGQQQEENDLVLGQGAAGQQRQTMYREEEALFHSAPGLDANALGVSQSY